MVYRYRYSPFSLSVSLSLSLSLSECVCVFTAVDDPVDMPNTDIQEKLFQVREY
jgi:hypothetical protein